MVNYSIQAKKTKIRGHKKVGLRRDVVEYDSRLEARVAQCLLRDDVYFEPHKKYDVFHRNGDRFSYTIDFDLCRPYKLKGVSDLVSAVEVKGVLKGHDFDRKDAWEYRTDRNMWIATTALVRYWYDEGIVEAKYQR